MKLLLRVEARIGVSFSYSLRNFLAIREAAPFLSRVFLELLLFSSVITSFCSLENSPSALEFNYSSLLEEACSNYT